MRAGMSFGMRRVVLFLACMFAIQALPAQAQELADVEIRYSVKEVVRHQKVDEVQATALLKQFLKAGREGTFVVLVDGEETEKLALIGETVILTDGQATSVKKFLEALPGSP